MYISIALYVLNSKRDCQQDRTFVQTIKHLIKWYYGQYLGRND